MSRDHFSPRFDRTHLWQGWQRPGSQPERQIPYDVQLITLKLADAIPQSSQRTISHAIRDYPQAQRALQRRQQLEEVLQQGKGCCLLQHPLMAAELTEALELHNRKRYKLIAWCIMPNHAHILLEPTYSMPRIVQAWKTATTRWMLMHKEELQLPTPGRMLWMRDYWDRYIPDAREIPPAIRQVHNSPVAAGLCTQPPKWRWSSLSAKMN